MPVSFDQNCLHLTFKPHLISESYTRNYRHLPNIVGYSITEKTLLKKVCRANLALFIFISSYCVETLK